MLSIQEGHFEYRMRVGGHLLYIAIYAGSYHGIGGDGLGARSLTKSSTGFISLATNHSQTVSTCILTDSPLPP